MRRRVVICVGFVLAASLALWLGLVWLQQHYHSLITQHSGVECSLIEPGLYLGGYVQEAPRGTTAVLNLCESEDPFACEVNRWEPIRDAAPAPDLDWLRSQVGFIDERRNAGGTVFVHCRAGVSRGGMVVVAYLMHEHGWSRDNALEFVRTKRPLVRPNPAFMERLEEWEEEIADRAISP
jgi:hypothetical protein